ncbi:ShlB/FhaC/HecB family hemolysin secretion/activation protein [Jannaschia sp. KMU-145]|uniref:ShlB/FhaC/HecB family hemolysin secretion/activation protein n=1 Tax=Jannaschia halovivens TaxID=3388667 RepID=UPI00396B1C7F
MKMSFAIAAFTCTIAAAAVAQERTFSLTGVTVYEAQTLLDFATQLSLSRGGVVTPEAVAATIETLYREDGYFLAEVFVSPDGSVLTVDEGAIGDIVIDGADPETAALIASYMLSVQAERPATLATFERGLMLSDDLGTVQVTSEIDYPDPAGPAQLRLVATELDRSYGFVTLDHPVRELGDAATITFDQTYLGALSAGDLLNFNLSATSDFAGDTTLLGTLRYRVPLGASGGYGEVYLGNVAARRDATGTLQQTDIEGRTAILAYGFPFVRNVEAYGYGLFELRSSETDVEVGGTTFEDDVTTIGASWIYGRTLENGGELEYALTYTLGRSDAGGGATFSHLRFGAGVIAPTEWFGSGSFASAEVWGQYSRDRLPQIEQFHVGGRDQDRGYVFAEDEGDTGASASLAMGRDFFPEMEAVRRVRPYSFLDLAFVSDTGPGGGMTNTREFASIGLGLDLEFENQFSVSSYVAVPLIDGPFSSEGDPALYLGLTRSW